MERWGFEMKWDGVRALVRIENGLVHPISRNQIDMGVSYPELDGLAEAFPGRQVLLDGEIVSFDQHGRPSFRRLQKRMHISDRSAARRLAAAEPVVLLAFDVLHLDGDSLLRVSYRERREILIGLELSGPAWQTPAAFTGDGNDAVQVSKDQGLEGVIAKRLNSGYLPGRRSGDWIKIKNFRTQEVVIGGWSTGQGRRSGLVGALLLGIPGESGLVYAGKVGTGFTEGMLRDIGSDLARIERETSPFLAVPRADSRTAHWVVPQLVGEVAFAEWTDDGRLRHPSWRGLRPDKSAADVVRES
jgi:bifunctional non-homologous end joining protein LigD